MYLSLFSFVFFYCSLIWGLPTTAGRNDVVRDYFTTPIRVLLDKGQQEIPITSLLNSTYAKEQAGDEWTLLPGKVRVSLSLNKKTILVNQIPFKGSVVYLRGGAQATDPIRYRSQLYRGALKITLTAGGLLITNVIPLENYLYGMLAGEMSPSWEMEALKAQVVASRTYAMYMLKHPKHALYDLEKGTADQVYLGANGESERAKIAVESTRDQVITHNNSPIKSYYHSRCGGTTESAKKVWNDSEKHLTASVPCPYCQKFPYLWKAHVKTKDFFEILNLSGTEKKSFKILLAEKTATGRVKAIAIETGNQKYLISSDDLRHLLGYANVKSARFELKTNTENAKNAKNAEDEIIFQGTGSGHGVGMCQWGAQFLAKQGKTYREILAHYYPSFHLYAPTPPLLP